MKQRTKGAILINTARETRDTDYPETVSCDSVADVLEAALESLLEGRFAEAATALASTIDTLRHVHKGQEKRTAGIHPRA